MSPQRPLTLSRARRGFAAGLLAAFAVMRAGAGCAFAQAVADGSPAATIVASTTSVIRHLANNVQGFRLAGEIASSEWPLYLTRAQAGYRLRFQVGYISAVSVMPEASTLTVAINDVPIGVTRIRAATGLKISTFDVPAGLLQPGFNSVRISALERHRVDCSVQATYELWTQIDPALTGLVLPPSDPGVTNLSDLPALAPNDEGALPIRVVLPNPATTEDVDRVLRAVEWITLVGRFEQPVVDIGPPAHGQYGINLVIGTNAELAQESFLPDSSDQYGPHVAVVPPHDGLRTTIVVSGVDEAQVEEAVDRLGASRRILGSRAGVRALRAFPGYRVESGQTVDLRAFGVRSEEFSGRLFHVGFNLMMPPDFYPADYGKVEVKLAGGYAAGLSLGAEVLVKVNGRDASSLRLTDRQGELFKDAVIPVPLGYLRPGMNRIEIEAHLPTAADRACDTLSMVASAKRFLFLDSTSIAIPPIARIGRMPDLAVTTTGAFPYARKDRRPIVWLPYPDRYSVAVAATLAARLALSAGAPLDFKVATRKPQQDKGPVLAVGPFASMDKGLLAAAHVDPERIASAWAAIGHATNLPASRSELQYEAQSRRMSALQDNLPAACHVLAPRLASAPVPRVGSELAPSVPEAFQGPKTDEGLASEWQARIDGGESWQTRLTGASAGAASFLNKGMTALNDLFGEERRSKARRSFFSAHSTLLVGQALLGSESRDLWTFVTAPNSSLLAEAADCLVDPRVWQDVSGRASMIDASDGRLVSLPSSDSRLIVTQPLSLENSRLIAAGWLSINSEIYVLLALIAAFLLAASTSWFISNVGRKNE